ncbi:winged helix-turn-helix transcriptional regulator [Tepidamorphus sp. 3E244]|uniref:winged helix-turn-helix transcriptional regulator n=1 Tax=Tepidamorphus sp. 3E244 TaxID=3385498 RepID=UPI0038FCD1BD
MTQTYRSTCPINLTLEALGDRWSLIVIRDLMFGNRRQFREILTNSEERIASNILADRLKKLVASGLLTREDHPDHKQKAVYSLTEKGIQLLPIIVQMGIWGRRHMPASPELAIRAQVMEKGGPDLWARFMDELRAIHLGAPAPERSVFAELQAAYLAEVARRGGAA